MAGDLTAGESPLVVIVGPTASGKTEVAIRLAMALGGEIICADSRTVYKGLDIGTAKPTKQEREQVPHHLLDVVNPDDRYTAARFQHDAHQAIADIRTRGNVSLLVGGSGLYIDSILFDYKFGPPPDEALRAKLGAYSIDELHRYSFEHNIELPNNSYNKRYIIRAIEQSGINQRRSRTPVPNTVIVGIATEENRLKDRITRRAQSIFANGVVEEAQQAARSYGWDSHGLIAPAYRMCHQLENHSISYDEAVAGLARADWQLARRQRTWFRRNQYINWMTLSEAESYVYSIFTHS